MINKDPTGNKPITTSSNYNSTPFNSMPQNYTGPNFPSEISIVSESNSLISNIQPISGGGDFDRNTRRNSNTVENFFNNSQHYHSNNEDINQNLRIF